MFGHRTDFVKLLQRHIFAAGDMAFPVFLRGAYIHQNRIGGSLIFLYALIDIYLFEKIKEANIL